MLKSCPQRGINRIYVVNYILYDPFIHKDLNFFKCGYYFFSVVSKTRNGVTGNGVTRNRVTGFFSLFLFCFLFFRYCG